MTIEVRNIRKKFGGFTALLDVSITVAAGRLVALLGPSGCGKTTLLRIIAGLETPDSGAIFFDGEDAAGRHARHRRVGFVFQHFALFRHMDVFGNIAFGLRVRPRKLRPPEEKIRARVHELLSLVQLEGLSGRYPWQLSGGQRQRVALARALAVEPKVLLLDEPFGALDAQVRKELRRWLRRLHDELQMTSVFVTHDQEEALEVADEVAVMNCGRIEQIGTPEEVYNHPANPFVYRFMGDVNLFHGRIEGEKAYRGSLIIELPAGVQPGARTAAVYVRPHMLQIDRDPPATGHFSAQVKQISYSGPSAKVDLMAEWGEDIEVEVSLERCQALSLREGAQVFLSVRKDGLLVTGFTGGEGI